jgi:peptidoglycan/xylan/chitin deacetylase (PgdA/CDA1 family)
MTKITIDTEPDLHSGNYVGITEGIPKLLKLLDKHQSKATFFTTADCIEKHPLIFGSITEKGHEVSSHGYRHVRCDNLSFKEKEEHLSKSVDIFLRYLGRRPKGFRAPQHSIDQDTLDLLEKYDFKYDSSYTPLNLLQLFFFPERFSLWLETFFSPRNPYRIRKKLWEIPPSSILIPYVSLVLRVFPKPILFFYIKTIKLLHKNPMLYIHSWDLIKIPQSRIDRKFPHTKVLDNLNYLLSLEK